MILVLRTRLATKDGIRAETLSLYLCTRLQPTGDEEVYRGHSCPGEQCSRAGNARATAAGAEGPGVLEGAL